MGSADDPFVIVVGAERTPCRASAMNRFWEGCLADCVPAIRSRCCFDTCGVLRRAMAGGLMRSLLARTRVEYSHFVWCVGHQGMFGRCRQGQSSEGSAVSRTNRRQQFSLTLVLALIVAAFGMMTLSFSGYRSPADLWFSLFSAPHDGSWTAISIDGHPVEPERYRIAIRNGEVTGGRDDCNDWGYAEGRAKNGDRMIVSTAVGCPEDDPTREAYWAVISNSKIELEHRMQTTERRASGKLPVLGGKLRVSGQGHEAILIRCEWKRVRETLPGGGMSDMQRCLPVKEFE